MLAGKRGTFTAVGLLLLHTGNPVIAGVVHADLPVASIHREPTFIAKVRISRLVLPTG